MPTIDPRVAVAFANDLRTARLAALCDAEAFDGVIHVVERLGSYLTRKQQCDNGTPSGLGGYTDVLGDLASDSGMAEEVPGQFRGLLTPFKALYKSVQVARNDALHQGAFARHLTKHAVDLAIILEDALTVHFNSAVTDFMVPNPVCAEPWQPIGFIRQQMLANSYSCLPVFCEDKHWRVVSGIEIAAFLRQESRSKERIKLLARTLDEASIGLKSAKFVNEKTPLDDALRFLKKHPILLVRNPRGKCLLGILTAFDLL